MFVLFELQSYSFAIPVLSEHVPNLLFNSSKQNVCAMSDFLCINPIWRSFVVYITQYYLGRLLRTELYKDLTSWSSMSNVTNSAQHEARSPL